MTFLDIIGNTPLVKLKSGIYAKLEMLNPTGSIKARIAKAMIEDAEKRGVLKAGSTIIEPTSGNTGIALAAIAAAKGYKIILTMPQSMSIERRQLLASYGAELVLTKGTGMPPAIKKAEELAGEIPNSFMPSQFSNPANPACHYAATGPEIWKDTNGKIDIFVSGIGTGGTISGAGKFLKEKNRNLKIVAVEPADSPVLSGGAAAPHKIEGIGAGFIPNTLNTSIYDEIIRVTTGQAVLAALNTAKTDGILAGISSGAALYAAEMLAARPGNADKIIVTVLPDGIEKYLSTGLFI